MSKAVHTDWSMVSNRSKGQAGRYDKKRRAQASQVKRGCNTRRKRSRRGVQDNSPDVEMAQDHDQQALIANQDLPIEVDGQPSQPLLPTIEEIEWNVLEALNGGRTCEALEGKDRVIVTYLLSNELLSWEATHG